MFGDVESCSACVAASEPSRYRVLALLTAVSAGVPVLRTGRDFIYPSR